MEVESGDKHNSGFFYHPIIGGINENKPARTTEIYTHISRRSITAISSPIDQILEDENSKGSTVYIHMYVY